VINHSPLHGLYLITNDDPAPVLMPKLEAALHSGIALLQYRRKQIPHQDQRHEAADIRALCTAYQIPLIINDDIDLAEQLHCGVHLGQGDGSLVDARNRLGAEAIIGRTCHASLPLAAEAAAEGASYLAFGAVYPSLTKPLASRVDLTTLEAARQFDLPICAIGGLTADNISPLKTRGVSLYAVIGDILNLPRDQIPHRMAEWQRQLT